MAKDKIYILGISAFFHDSAASLICDGEIVAAAQEERFTRIKGDASFPINSIEYCLKEAGIDINGLTEIVFYDKPIKKFDRILSSYMHRAPVGVASFVKAVPLWLKDKLWIEDLIKKTLKYKKDILFTEHHESHAASAFYPSPFESAAVLTVDGAGEWTTTAIGIGTGNKIKLIKEINFPHSLGLLYSAFTYYCGFRVNSGEYKLMGLAPYGEPVFKELIYKELITVFDDGSYILNEKYFNYITGLRMISGKFEKLFGRRAQKPDGKPDKFYMDVAASIQVVFDEIMVRIARFVQQTTGMKNLVMAGGVALNCVSNAAIVRSGIFESVWIQPASGDAGGSLGAALFAYHNYLGGSRTPDGVNDSQQGSYLGPAFDDDEIKGLLDAEGIVYSVYDENELVRKTADFISGQRVVGWFQGRMEFGPRSLGARSILGDPRNEEMQKNMNLKIKFRESFRPFAPSVLAEKCGEWFETNTFSPYMLLVANVKKDRLYKYDSSQKGLGLLDVKRSEISAVTHVDNSARLQTVTAYQNQLYHSLLTEFYRLTGCPVLINTSFNVRGEPIVCTPLDALRCFFASNIDVLVMGSCVILKEEQNIKMDLDEWRKKLIKD